MYHDTEKVVSRRVSWKPRPVYASPMFTPEEVIFAPTNQCNLHCRHCRVTRLASELDTGSALAFLGDCAAHGVELVGFSGGEPFLRPDFLVEVSRAAVALDLRFDRLMTNGVWWKDEAGLRSTLQSVCEAGFDGTIGLSVDAWHGQDPARLGTFVSAVFDTWARKDCVELLAVEKQRDAGDLPRLEALALSLGGSLVTENGDPVTIVNEIERARAEGATGAEDPEALLIPVRRSPYSAGSDEAAWNAGEWFEDDFCAGPGNVFYVHPDGSVAACCGFANDREALILGNIARGGRGGEMRAPDGYESLMRSASTNAHLRSCYVAGLGARRKELEAAGWSFPGKTDDICFFCDWICERGMDQAPSTRGHG
jgi:hypothetical protein